jgi:peptide/nickel transport system permease protein
MTIVTDRRRAGGSAWSRGFRAAVDNRGVLMSIAVLLLIVSTAIFSDVLGGGDPLQIRPRARLTPPGAAFWFGSDALGRDVFSLVLHGARLSLMIGVLTALFSAVAGTLLGLVAGYFRRTDTIVMRVLDGVMAIPGVLFAVALVSLVGPSVMSVVAAISFAEIPRVTRLVRSVVLIVREEAYVRAAEGMGIPAWRVMFRHIMPSCVAPLVVQVTYIFAAAILAEATLGFLGVGFPPDIPTWGNVLAGGRSVFQRGPWTILAPGVFLSMTVMAVNILGDGLRDKLDPKLSRKTRMST